MMKRLIAGSALLAAGSLTALPAQAEAITDTEITTVPLDMFLPGCDNNVHVTGTSKNVFHLIELDDGRLQISSHWTNQGIRGVDEDGNVYRFVYSSQSRTSMLSEADYSAKWVYRFRLIGTRGAPTYTSALVYHVRVTDGVLTTVVDRTPGKPSCT
jgi:hypothetical protein